MMLLIHTDIPHMLITELENGSKSVWEKVFANKKVQVGKDQEKAKSEKDSHSKNQGGKKPN